MIQDQITKRPSSQARAASSARPDFEQLFRTMSGQYMILDLDMKYVDANAAYCAAVEQPLESFVGRNVFEVFPPTGEGGRQVEESLRRVAVTGVAETLPLVAYPIPSPSSDGFMMKYWSCVHLPLFDAEGRVAFVAQNAVDVTELQQLKTIAYGPGQGAPARGESDLFRRAQEMAAINDSLAKETQGLRDLFMQAPSFMAVLTGPDLTFALVNTAYQQLIGNRQVIGRPLAEAVPEVAEQGFIHTLRTVLREGRPYIGQSMGVMLQRTPVGPPEQRFVDFIFQPIFDAGGQAWGVFVEGSDVTDRVRAEHQQKLLVDELNHRVKNTLATVQAIADQTLRSTAEPEEFREAFESRLMALSSTHDLLTATSWRSAGLRDVLLAELKPYAADRYRLEGPEVDLTPARALALGLLLHELATNAAKYGALSANGGCVRVAWRLEDGILELVWTETDGPPVTQPSRRGFGSRLIERSLQGALGGSASLEFQPEGLRCRVKLPLDG